MATLALAMAAPPAAGSASQGPIRYVYVVPLSHLDLGFTGTPPEVAALQKQYLDQAMAFAEADARYRWTIENVYQYDQWAARTEDPGQFQRLRSLIAGGRIELAAGYANSHEGQWGAEEANRFLYPGLAAASDMHTTLRTAVVDDVPGSSAALPQILAGNGVTNLVAGINTAFGGEPDIPMAESLFRWRGIDGSEVLTWISRRSYAEGIFSWCLGCAYDDMERLTQRRIDEYQDAGYAYDSVIAMHGFDNAGPDLILGALDNVDRWNREHASPKLIVSTPTPFFDHVRQTYGDGFAVHSGDWSGRWETNDAYTPLTTAMVRSSKTMAPVAEALGSLARLYGVDPDPPPLAGFDGLYRGQLQFDEHSGAGGGSPDLTEAQVRGGNIWWSRLAVATSAGTDRLLQDAVTALAGGIASDRRALAVVNPMTWARTDLVRVPLDRLPRDWLRSGPPMLVDLSTGATVPTQLVDQGGTVLFRADDLPPLGYKLFAPALGTGASPPPSFRRSPLIENEFYRLEVDPETGAVVSLFDKVERRQVADGWTDFEFGEAVSAFQNGAFIWGTYRHEEPSSVQIEAETGPVATTLTVRRTGSPHTLTRWWLYRGLRRLDSLNEFDRSLMPPVSHDRHSRWYFLTYPFAIGPGFEGRFQGPNGYLVPQRDWMSGTQHGARVSRTVTDIRGSDGFGVTVANRENYLSAFGGLGFWNEGSPAAPILFPVPAAKIDEIQTGDHGWVTFRTLEPGLPTVYRSSVSFTTSGAGFDPVGAAGFGGAFDADLLTAVVRRNPTGPLPGPAGSLLRLDAPNVTVTTIKGAEDGSTDLILRVQEISGQATVGVKLLTDRSFDAAELDGMGEQRDGAIPLPVDPVAFDIGALQTLTIRLRWAPP